LDIIVIALCGAICGVDNAEELEEFGEAKEVWFRTFLELPHGIPSQDTFLRVFAALDPQEFRTRFVAWVESLREHGCERVVAVDGKSIRAAIDAARGGLCVHMVNAWLCEEGLVLGSLRTAAKSNEITAVPELLRLLNIKGCTVTTDAMGCQREIARTIVAGGGDYILQVADNQKTMHKDIADYFDYVEKGGDALGKMSRHETVDSDHGRVEERRYQHTTDIDWFQDRAKWAGLASFAEVVARRTDPTTNRTSEETRYYLSSYGTPNAERAGKTIRNHWGVENQLHWVLDMAFSEDRSRWRTGNAAENFAIVRHVAINLIKRETSKKKGVLTKRKRCGWDHDYLLKVIGLHGDA
jgi:predicted transposase YbfD/YdcC